MLTDQVKWDYDIVVMGEPASAKNQRRIVRVKGQPRIIKSKKALDYAKSFNEQLEPLDVLMEGDLALRLDVWYASRRPDLAALDLVMDLLQDIVYANDRQVKVNCSFWNIDRENPRTRIRIKKLPEELSQGTSSLDLSEIWG